MNSRRLFAATGVVILLVGIQVQAWVLVLGVLFLGWKAAVEFGGLAKPSRWLTNSLTVVFLGLVLARYRTLLGQESSASFLLLLTSLKLLEERSLRDQKFLLLLDCVLLSSMFLFTIELPYLIGGLAAFYLMWSAQNSSLSYGRHFLKALPYVIFLFLFFPRVQNPFGLQGANVEAGTTGFSDDLNPGSISKIQTSRELAFRVQFLKPLKLRTRDQYWRGQVLRYSEGLHWTKKPTQGIMPPRDILNSPDYEITLEPHGHRWLFALDPTEKLFSAEFPLFFRDASVFEAFSPIRERVSYVGVIASHKMAPDTAVVEKIDLQTPEFIAPEVTAFVHNILVANATRAARAQAFLSYFHREHFTYSKSPGAGSGTLEGFLFKNKKGYCEHYAAALATLLRLAQVPTRVVTGYQGGVYNNYGKFWRFTQADAHAWVEFLNDENLWERIDPTSEVAPERLEFGGLLFEDLPEEWIGQNKGTEFLKSREAWWLRAKNFVSDGIETMNYQVILFLIDFNIEKQKELLAQYGGWAVFAGALLFLPFLLHSFYRRRKLTQGEWLLQILERKARALGLQRDKSETLRNFVMRWQAERPEHRLALAQLLKIYEGLEYSVNFKGFEPRELRTLTKSLKAP